MKHKLRKAIIICVILYVCYTALMCFAEASRNEYIIDEFDIPNSAYTLVLKHSPDDREIRIYYSSDLQLYNKYLGSSLALYSIMPDKDDYSVSIQDKIASVRFYEGTQILEGCDITFNLLNVKMKYIY